MRDRHQHPVARVRERLELGGQRLLHAQRVVADGLELARNPGEEGRAIVQHGADPAVHDLRRADDAAAVRPAEPLVAEAYPEQRDVGRTDGVRADAEVADVVRSARTRRDHDVLEGELRQLRPAAGVVVQHDRLLAIGLREQLEEVVGERVVVVDQERLQTLCA